MEGVPNDNFNAYQNAIYAKGMFANAFPLVTTDPNALEEQARKHLSPRAFAYVYGGAGALQTQYANRAAFRQWHIIPRMMRDTSVRDLSVDLFGKKISHPIIMAPIGVQSLFNEDGEISGAEIAEELEVPYCMSTAATVTIEETGKANGNGERWVSTPSGPDHLA
jgi:lactate 2-monooxygenase